METLKSLRERARFSQKEVANALGTHQPVISAMENGERSITNTDIIAKLAGMYGVSQRSVKSAIDHTERVRSIVSEATTAIDTADPDEQIKLAAYLYRIASDRRLSDPIRDAASKTIESNGEAIKQASQTLAAGVTGSLVRTGDNLNQNIDPQGLRVARDGDGNWYLVDTTTDPPTVSPVQFGDLVQQAGQPMGSKVASKNKTTQRYGGSGSQRRRMRESE